MKFITLAAIASTSLFCLTADAGPVGGARYAESVVEPGKTDVYEFRLNRGEVTFISVQGNGASDFDCAIADLSGDVYDRDENDIDQCFLEVQPSDNRVFRLYIGNFGRDANRYSMAVR